MDAGRMIPGQVQQPQAKQEAAGQKPAEEEKSWITKVADYFEPRPTTESRGGRSSAMSGAFGGGLQGYFVGGPQGAVGGVMGGYTGVKMGEKTGSMKKALLASTVAGVGGTLLAAAGIAALAAGPAGIALYMLTAGAIGAGAGLAGNVIEALKQQLTGKSISGEGEAPAQENAAPGSGEASIPGSPAAGISEETAAMEGDISSLATAGTAEGKRTFLQKVKDLAGRGIEKLTDTAKSLFEKFGTLAASGTAGALIGSGVALLGGPVGIGIAALAGALSGIAGAAVAKAANKANWKLPKLKVLENAGLSTILGASTTAIIGAGAFALAASNPVGAALALGAAAVIGGLSGVAGTLGGSKSGKIRDGSYGGYLSGMLTKAFPGLGGPLMPLGASIGGASGAKMETLGKKIARAALVGGSVGALTGAFGGPVAMAINGALGAAFSVLGAFVGPKIQQGVRNLNEDVQKKLKPLSDRVADALISKLGPKYGLIANGALSGAIGYLPMSILGGALMGPAGAIAPPVIGAVTQGLNMAKVSKDLENIKLLRVTLEKSGPGMEDMGTMMCATAFRQIEKTMTDATPEQKQAYFNQYLAGTMEELKGMAPQIAELRNGLSNMLYNEVKAELKTIKSEEEKKKLLEERISAARPVLTQMMVGGLIDMLQQQSVADPSGTQAAPTA